MLCAFVVFVAAIVLSKSKRMLWKIEKSLRRRTARVILTERKKMYIMYKMWTNRNHSKRNPFQQINIQIFTHQSCKSDKNRLLLLFLLWTQSKRNAPNIQEITKMRTENYKIIASSPYFSCFVDAVCFGVAFCASYTPWCNSYHKDIVQFFFSLIVCLLSYFYCFTFIFQFRSDCARLKYAYTILKLRSHTTNIICMLNSFVSFFSWVL